MCTALTNGVISMKGAFTRRHIPLFGAKCQCVAPNNRKNLGTDQYWPLLNLLACFNIFMEHHYTVLSKHGTPIGFASHPQHGTISINDANIRPLPSNVCNCPSKTSTDHDAAIQDNIVIHLGQPLTRFILQHLTMGQTFLFANANGTHKI